MKFLMFFAGYNIASSMYLAFRIADGTGIEHTPIIAAASAITGIWLLLIGARK